jgi:biotin carboxyl carrier protein
MRLSYRRERRDGGGAASDAHEVIVEKTGELSAHVATGSISTEFSIAALSPGHFRMSDGSRSWRVWVDSEGPVRHITVEGVGERRFQREASGRRRRRELAHSDLASPMPGTVVKVLVAAGETVVTGQDLLIVEAMKMEIKVSAQVAGKVRAIHVSEGDSCDAGQILAEIDA